MVCILWLDFVPQVNINSKNTEDDAGYGEFFIGARPYPEYSNSTWTLDIYWEWNSPGEAS